MREWGDNLQAPWCHCSWWSCYLWCLHNREQPSWWTGYDQNLEKHLLHLVKQVKMQSFKASPHYKFGHPVPCTYYEALWLNLKNGNTKWQDATKLEMEQLWLQVLQGLWCLWKGSPLRDTRRSECILYLTSSMMLAIRPDVLLMTTSLNSDWQHLLWSSMTLWAT